MPMVKVLEDAFAAVASLASHIVAVTLTPENADVVSDKIDDKGTERQKTLWKHHSHLSVKMTRLNNLHARRLQHPLVSVI